MTANQKEQLISAVLSVLQTGIIVSPVINESASINAVDAQPLEMLTLKECADVVKGISEHTLRLLVTQGKIPSIRTGEGKRGKILVSKSALVSYFN